MNSGPNWARRYGPNHRRLCARPGCGAPAAATLRFQPTQREAWLVELEDDAARTEGDLCARHAAGLVLPRGWQLHDSLQKDGSETTLRASEAPAPTVTPRPPRPVRGASIARARRRRVSRSAVELPGFSPIAVPDLPGPEAAEPGPAPVEVPVVEAPVVEVPVVEIAIVPQPAPLVAPPTPEASSALAETLDAQTPLLRRAFSNVFPADDSPDDDKS